MLRGNGCVRLMYILDTHLESYGRHLIKVARQDLGQITVWGKRWRGKVVIYHWGASWCMDITGVNHGVWISLGWIRVYGYHWGESWCMDITGVNHGVWISLGWIMVYGYHWGESWCMDITGVTQGVWIALGTSMCNDNTGEVSGQDTLTMAAMVKDSNDRG